METVLSAAAPSLDPATELIDLSCPEDPFQRMKSCSVVTYGEATLMRLPWSGLQRKNERGLPSLNLEVAEDASAASGLRWSVSNRAAPLPGTYERSVFRALEWIALDGSLARGVPFANPLVVHPRDICERLCWRATQPQFEAIEQAMQNLCRLEIEESSPAAPGRPAAVSRFGLLRSAIAGTQRTVNRSLTCPHFIVYFDRFFVDSVNAGRIRPLNWGLWIALRDPAAQRLLEIIDPEFANHDGRVTASVESDVLSRLLPLPSLPRNRRRILLEQAHELLVRRGYLRKVERHASGSAEFYLYHPGSTRQAMQFRLEQQPGVRSHRKLVKTVPGGVRGKAQAQG
ncbi:MAG TPA: hypothetical protein VNM14_01835 [Planctomycetota bacterium]|nr:hypothetical protein [Planctomycetota bacterium]